jgi:proteasome lid subunit RPN8/RPN11
LKANTPNPDLPDIRRLRDEDLSKAEFPGGKRQDFRIYFAPETHSAIWAHAHETTAVEVCGVLVGQWSADGAGPFLNIAASIKGDAAQSKFTEVTFTHETWSKINDEMDKKYAHLKIVGWYHTHPDFGIFLSERDTFIQEHFFAGPGQVAHVVDPVRKLEGVFLWKEGRPSLAPSFWVGNDLKLAPATSGDSVHTATQAGSDILPPARVESASSRTPLWERLVTYGLMFLIGFLLALNLSGQRSAWEQERLTEGVVAHYGLWHGLKPGFDERIEALRGAVKQLSERTHRLSDKTTRDLKESGESKALKADWQAVDRQLVSLSADLTTLKSLYGVDSEQARRIEQAVVDRLINATAPVRAPSPNSTESSKPVTKTSGTVESAGKQNTSSPKDKSP